jgi:hypothetical protein
MRCARQHAAPPTSAAAAASRCAPARQSRGARAPGGRAQLQQECLRGGVVVAAAVSPRARPIGLTTQAGAGKHGLKYIRDLGFALACKRNRTPTPSKWQVANAVRKVRERVGVALMRELADQVIANQ